MEPICKIMEQFPLQTRGKTACPPPSQGGAGGGSAGSAGSAGSGPFPRRLKGVLTVLNEANDCEFRAQRSTGESTQRVISKSGDGKLYQTTGKKPQMVAHLTTRADATDPISDLYDQLDKMAAQQQPKTAKQRPQRERVLMDEGGVKVTMSKAAKRVTVTMNINMAETPHYQQHLLKLFTQVQQCFLTNELSLVKLRS